MQPLMRIIADVLSWFMSFSAIGGLSY